MGFSDNTGGAGLQRGGSIPTGGMRVEAGCWTKADATDLKIPTLFTEVISLVINDGTVRVVDVPDITPGFIFASTSGTPSGKLINYVSFGY